MAEVGLAAVAVEGEPAPEAGLGLPAESERLRLSAGGDEHFFPAEATAVDLRHAIKCRP